MYAGTPTHPVTQALQPHLAAYDLQQEHLQAIIDGMEMDLDQIRYLDYAGLQQVLLARGRRGRHPVGQHLRRDRAAAPCEYAEKLGLAFQLTNIIRDVGEDARKGRIYLPVNELQQFGVTAADILNARHSEKFEALMAFQADRAQRHLRRSVRAAAEGRPARPASRPDDGGHLPHRCSTRSSATASTC